MEKKEEYDFFQMGKRCAKERMDNLFRMAEKIEQEYGIDARLEFESGMAIIVPVYANNSYLNQDIKLSTIESASRVFGLDNRINSSYLKEEKENTTKENEEDIKIK